MKTFASRSSYLKRRP